MLESVLIWLLVEILTKASEKWKVSQTYLAVGLSILLWAWYYIATKYYSVERKQVVEFVAWVYASSQLLFSLFKKRWIFNQKKDEQKK